MPSQLSNQARKNQLYAALSGDAFDLGDLRELCFKLAVDWDNLHGEIKPARALSIIRHFEKHDDLPALAQAVHEARSHLDLSLFDPDWVGEGPSTKLAALHRIPSPVLDFTGRAEKIQNLIQTVENGHDRALIVSIRGTGGVGKSQLAYLVAREVSHHYPDGSIMVELRGMARDGAQPLAPQEGLQQVILALSGSEQKLPTEPADLQAHYHANLKGKRLILLLDDARDRAHVEPFLPPPPGCLVLITTRNHFTVPGLIPCNLDELEEDESVQLLLAIAPRLEPHAPELARLGGRLPLALRVVGSLAAEKVNLRPEDVLRRMQDETRRLNLTGFDAAIAVSYAALNEQQQRDWRRLGVFAGDFSAAAAARIWELAPADSSEPLDETILDAVLDRLGLLCQYSLVEYDSAGDRYNLHDLARLSALNRMDDAERHAARRAHAAYYLSVISRADDLFESGRDQMLLGLAKFDTERHEIEAGFAWAAAGLRTTPPDRDRLEMCMRYPLGGPYLLSIRQHPHDQIHWLEVALAAARALGDRRSEGNALGNLGNAYSDLGEPRLAIEYYEQRLAIARETGDRQGEGAALGNLGVAYRDLGEPRRAVEYHEQCLAIARETGDRQGEGAALGNLGVAYRNLGEPRRAVEFFEQHLAIARETGDRQGESISSWNLGLVLKDEGDLPRAIEYMQTTVNYEREIGHPDAESDAQYVQSLRDRLANPPSDPPASSPTPNPSS